jgi:hypothetical protein
MVAIARARCARSTPPEPQRRQRPAATATIVPVVGCSKVLTMSGLKGSARTAASRWTRSDRPLPSREGRRSRTRAVDPAAVLSGRELGHALADHELDLGDLREIDEAVRFDHGMGTLSITSLITTSIVMPWLAACGPSQIRWPRILREIPDVLRVDPVRRRTSSAHTFAMRPYR